MKRLEVRLSDEEYQILQEWAAEQMRPPSAQLRYLYQQVLLADAHYGRPRELFGFPMHLVDLVKRYKKSKFLLAAPKEET